MNRFLLAIGIAAVFAAASAAAQEPMDARALLAWRAGAAESETRVERARVYLGAGALEEARAALTEPPGADREADLLRIGIEAADPARAEEALQAAHRWLVDHPGASEAERSWVLQRVAFLEAELRRAAEVRRAVERVGLLIPAAVLFMILFTFFVARLTARLS